MTTARRRSRTLVVQALYEIDSTGHEVERAIDHLLVNRSLSEQNVNFARDLLNGIIQNKKKIDEYIQHFAPTWPIEQISAVDKNILRLAIFEILIDNKVPVKVSINEAVELAKAFGSDNSSKFVNGVLGSVSNLINK